MAQGQWKAKNLKPAKNNGRGTPPYGAAVGLPAAVNVQGRVKDVLIRLSFIALGEVHPPAQVPNQKLWSVVKRTSRETHTCSHHFAIQWPAPLIPTFCEGGDCSHLRSGPRSHGHPLGSKRRLWACLECPLTVTTLVKTRRIFTVTTNNVPSLPRPLANGASFQHCERGRSG